jgi:hypothetical protein
MSGNFSSAKLKTIFDYTFPIMFAVHAVNYISYLWYMDIVKKCFNAVKC